MDHALPKVSRTCKRNHRPSGNAIKMLSACCWQPHRNRMLWALAGRAKNWWAGIRRMEVQGFLRWHRALVRDGRWRDRSQTGCFDLRSTVTVLINRNDDHHHQVQTCHSTRNKLSKVKICELFCYYRQESSNLLNLVHYISTSFK